MKRFTGVFFGMLLTLALANSLYAAPAKFVKITVPFAKVYQYLDPTSMVVKQAKQGEYYRFVSEGTSWYQIKVDENVVGWLEKTQGELVTREENSIGQIPISLIVIMIIGFIVTIGAVGYFISRQQAAESEQL
jgi:hypothetical protein